MLHAPDCRLCLDLGLQDIQNCDNKNSPEDLGSESKKSWDCGLDELAHLTIRTSALDNSEIGVSSTIDGIELTTEKGYYFSYFKMIL